MKAREVASVGHWRQARAIALLPGTVTVAVPAAILIAGDGPEIGWGLDGVAAVCPVLLGLALIAAGVALWIWTVRLFARIGKGTLAPWDPTRRLVVAGPYRYVRNPMISAVLCVLLGEAALFGSPALLIWFGGLLRDQLGGLRRLRGARPGAAVRRRVPRVQAQRAPLVAPAHALDPRARPTSRHELKRAYMVPRVVQRVPRGAQRLGGHRRIARLRSVVGLLVVAGFAGAPASAAAVDYAQTALNIIPSGQYGGVPPPSGADTQAKMYDGLTPRFDQVTNAHLLQFFKSERFGVDTAGPGDAGGRSVPRGDHRPRQVQRSARVRHHLRRRDLGRRLDRRRGSRPAAPAGSLQRSGRRDRRPGAERAGPDLRPAVVPARAPRRRPRSRSRPRSLQNAGPEGQAVLRDIDNFISGINDYLELNGPSTAAVDAQRRLRASTPSRGSSWARAAATRPAARSSSAACSSGSGRTGARASSTTCASSRTPRARPRSTAPSTTGRFPATRRAA